MFDRIIVKPSKVLSIIGMGILIPMMLLDTVDVILRKFFNSPILGAHEITGFMLVILVFMNEAYTLLNDGHTVIDIVTEKLPLAVQALLRSITYLFSIFIVGLITWQSAIYGYEKWRQGVTIATIPLKTYPFVFVVSLGSCMLCLALVGSFLKSLDYWRQE